jgi:hypothetical protein
MGAEAQGRGILKIRRQVSAKILKSIHDELFKLVVEISRCGFPYYFTNRRLYLEGCGLYPHA